MIISASRRTDIPAFYLDWFYNRIKEGYVLVRNPMNVHQISRINLSPDVVDCIVFWTKNPEPMIARLDELEDYNYYFQFTLNSYSKDIEAGVPSKHDEIIQTFKRLSNKIGSQRVIWRYDPILINEKYNLEYHKKYFEKLVGLLNGAFETCTISFVDYYKKAAKNFKEHNINELNYDTMVNIAECFSEIANRYEFKINTCAETIDLSQFGISHSKCIDDKLIEKIIGKELNIFKDKNQRKECGCVESIDIGSYNTCLHGCKYCYANYSNNVVSKNAALYDANSPILCSHLTSDDIIKERPVRSFIQNQLEWF